MHIEGSYVWEQAIVTFFIGLISFVITQLLVLFFFKPIKDLKRSIGYAYEKVEFAKNKYYNPIFIGKETSVHKTEEYINSSNSLRTAAARIKGVRATVPFYNQIYKVFKLPSNEQLKKISKSLIYLYNSHWRSANEDDWMKYIEKAEKDFYESTKLHWDKE